MSWWRNPWVHRALGVLLGGVFLYAAHEKVLDPRPLVTIIWNYRILPPGPVNLMAIYMPWMELVIGLGLVTGFKRRGAALWASLLLVAFSFGLLVNAVRGVNVACGCFSTSATETHNAWLLVVRDLPMLVAALWMLLLPPSKPAAAPNRQLTRPRV